MRDVRPLTWLTLGCFSVFVVLLVLVVVGGPTQRLDEAVRRACEAHREATLTDLATWVTDVFSPLLDALVLTVGAAAVAWRRGRFWPVVAAATTGWAMVVVVVVIKHAVGRFGPHPLDTASGTSFPSGHTASVLVCLGALALLVGRRRPRWLPALLTAVGALTVVVATALVYADFHWLTDCVASIALGVGMLGLLQLWLTRHVRRRA